MPSFAWQLNDEQIAAVVSYVRNAWPPIAGPVSAAQVSKVHISLQNGNE